MDIEENEMVIDVTIKIIWITTTFKFSYKFGMNSTISKIKAKLLSEIKDVFEVVPDFNFGHYKLENYWTLNDVFEIFKINDSKIILNIHVKDMIDFSSISSQSFEETVDDINRIDKVSQSIPPNVTDFFLSYLNKNDVFITILNTDDKAFPQHVNFVIDPETKMGELKDKIQKHYLLRKEYLQITFNLSEIDDELSLLDLKEKFGFQIEYLKLNFEYDYSKEDEFDPNKNPKYNGEYQLLEQQNNKYNSGNQNKINNSPKAEEYIQIDCSVLITLINKDQCASHEKISCMVNLDMNIGELKGLIEHEHKLRKEYLQITSIHFSKKIDDRLLLRDLIQEIGFKKSEEIELNFEYDYSKVNELNHDKTLKDNGDNDLLEQQKNKNKSGNRDTITKLIPAAEEEDAQTNINFILPQEKIFNNKNTKENHQLLNKKRYNDDNGYMEEKGMTRSIIRPKNNFGYEESDYRFNSSKEIYTTEEKKSILNKIDKKAKNFESQIFQMPSIKTKIVTIAKKNNNTKTSSNFVPNERTKIFREILDLYHSTTFAIERPLRIISDNSQKNKRIDDFFRFSNMDDFTDKLYENFMTKVEVNEPSNEKSEQVANILITQNDKMIVDNSVNTQVELLDTNLQNTIIKQPDFPDLIEERPEVEQIEQDLQDILLSNIIELSDDEEGDEEYHNIQPILIADDVQEISPEQTIKNMFDTIYDDFRRSRITKTELYKNFIKFEQKLEEIKITKEFLKFHKKLEVVLDLDNTLLSTEFNSREIVLTSKEYNNPEIVCSSIYINNQISYYKTIFRPGLKEFLDKLSKFSNFYINTLGMEEYAYQIADHIREIYKHNIPRQNIIYRTTKELKKDLSFSNIDKERVVIFDDTCNVWKQNSELLIPSMKFYYFYKSRLESIVSKDAKIFDNFNLTLSFPCIHENYLSNKSNTRPFLVYANHADFRDDKNFPLISEHDFSNKKQFTYLTSLYEKVYKIVSITNIKTKCILSVYKSSVLLGLIFNIDYLQDDDEPGDERRNFIKSIIETLGGSISNKNATHFIILKINKNIFQERRANNEIKSCKYALNMKYIFHSYYFITRMNENDTEYQI